MTTELPIVDLHRLSFGRESAGEDTELPKFFLETPVVGEILQQTGTQLLTYWVVGRRGTGKSSIGWYIKRRSAKESLRQPGNICVFIRQQDEETLFVRGTISEQAAKRLFPHKDPKGLSAGEWAWAWKVVVLEEISRQLLDLRPPKQKRGRQLTYRHKDVANPYREIKAYLVANRRDVYLGRVASLVRAVRTIRATVEVGIEKALRVTFSSQPDIQLSGQVSAGRLEKAVMNLLSSEFKQQKVYILFDELDEGQPADRLSSHQVLGVLQASVALNSLSNQLPNRNIRTFVFIRQVTHRNTIRREFQEYERYRGWVRTLRWGKASLLQMLGARIRAAMSVPNPKLPELDAEVWERTFASESLPAAWPEPLEEAAALWQLVFPRYVYSMNIATPSFQYIIERTQMRPREIIALCNKCLEHANRHGASKISENDILRAAKETSVDKIDDLCKEFGIEYPKIEELLSGLKKKRRFSVLCFRRITLEKDLDSVLKDSKLAKKVRNWPKAAMDVLAEISVVGCIPRGSRPAQCENDRIEYAYEIGEVFRLRGYLRIHPSLWHELTNLDYKRDKIIRSNIRTYSAFGQAIDDVRNAVVDHLTKRKGLDPCEDIVFLYSLGKFFHFAKLLRRMEFIESKDREALLKIRGRLHSLIEDKLALTPTVAWEKIAGCFETKSGGLLSEETFCNKVATEPEEHPGLSQLTGWVRDHFVSVSERLLRGELRGAFDELAKQADENAVLLRQLGGLR